MMSTSTYGANQINMKTNAGMTLLAEDHSLSDESFMMDLFDFDFSDELSIPCSAVHSTDSDTSSVAGVEADWHGEKSPAYKRSSKFMRKATSSVKPVKIKPAVVATHAGLRCLKPNMSRRTRDTMLYAFPSFDRCDSLLFFPSTLARHLNSGDIPSVAKLVSDHIAKNCDIRSSKPSPHRMDVQTMIRKCEIVEELHPDHITCIHSTRVEGNQIKGMGFMKFTCSRAISHHMLNKIQGTDLSNIFKCSWDKDIRPAVEQETWPEEEKHKMLLVIDAGADFIVHAKMQITITLDDSTKKIKSLVFDIDNTSMEEAKHAVPSS